MTSSAHDDRIEVLSVVPMPPPPSVHGESGGGVGRTGSKRTSRGHRKSNSGQSLGTISASVMADGAEGGAIGGVGGGGGAAGLSRTGSGASRRQSGTNSSMGVGHGGSRRSSSHGGSNVRRSHSNSERHHRQNSQHHHRQNSYPPPQQAKPHQGRSDSRRSRGYTYLVPSPDDQVKVVGAGLHNERGLPLSQIKEPKTEQQKRIARIVMVLATIMLGLSLLLVGVTLSMSDHIDEMATTTSTSVITPPVNTTLPVRIMNGLSTTVRPPSPTAASLKNLTTTSKPTSSQLPSL